MTVLFRNFEKKDKDEILSMMEIFYNSDAVHTNGSQEIFLNDINECLNNSQYLEGYTFVVDSKIAGYAMLAKSFSTEFGKKCIWFEDLYLKKEYRGKKIVPQFIEFIEKKYNNSIFRLEVEDDNKHACHVYSKMGFKKIPYDEMVKYL